MEQELRTLPHSLEIEQSLLSSCFVDPEFEAWDTLQPEHFYNKRHQRIYQACLNLHKNGEPIDAAIVAAAVKEHVEGSYLGSILDFPPAIDENATAKQILGYYRLRELIKLSHAIQKRAYQSNPSGVDDVIKYASSELSRVDVGGASGWQPLESIVLECIDRCEELQQRKGITGVTSGFSDLDRFTCGFQPGDLVILAARPGMGKTAFAINSMAAAAEKGVKSGILSLEMVRSQLGNRFLSLSARINALKFRSGNFTQEDWERFSTVAGKLCTYGVWIDDSPKASYQDVEIKCRDLVRRYGAQILWIDYLGFLDGDKDQNKVNEVQSITRAIKQTAKAQNIPIVLICQLSRECEKRPNKKPILADLRDSGAIEQDADVVLFLYRENYYKPNIEDTTVELAIAKQRNGPTGTVKLQWQEEFTKFNSLAREYA